MLSGFRTVVLNSMFILLCVIISERTFTESVVGSTRIRSSNYYPKFSQQDDYDHHQDEEAEENFHQLEEHEEFPEQYFYDLDDGTNEELYREEFHDYDHHLNSRPRPLRYNRRPPFLNKKRKRYGGRRHRRPRPLRRRNPHQPQSHVYDRLMGYYNLKGHHGHGSDSYSDSGYGYGYEEDGMLSPYESDMDDGYFHHNPDLYSLDSQRIRPPDFEPPPPYPPPPFGHPDPGFKTQTGFEGFLVPNSWYGLLPWGIEGVIIVIAGIIIFVIIVIAILCLIAWFCGIRKIYYPNLIKGSDEDELLSRYYDKWSNSTSSINLSVGVLDALEKYQNISQQGEGEPKFKLVKVYENS